MTVDRAAVDAFMASLAGSGNLNVGNVQATTVALDLAGSGDLMIGGRTKRVDISSAGSGDISAKTLEAETVKISLAGSGNASAIDYARIAAVEKNARYLGVQVIWLREPALR